MKELILSNESNIISAINESLAASAQGSEYIVDGIFTVAQGRGVRKNVLQFSVVHKGISTVMVNFDTTTLKPLNGKTLGKYSKEETNDMINVTWWVYYQFILPVLNKLTVVEEVSVTVEQTEEVEIVVNNQMETIKKVETTQEESYTVANKTFITYQAALQYCNDVDYDPELMIEGAGTSQPLETTLDNNETIEPTEVFTVYKELFNTYSEAYNYCITNDYPVTMILSSLHTTMNNERLQQLELEYKFSKHNMSINDMKEYFDYIMVQPVSTDQTDRYYKLRSWIERHETKQRNVETKKQHEKEMALRINDMINDLYSIGMVKKEYEHTSTTWYYLNNELIYNWSSGIPTEKMYNELVEVYNKFYKQSKAV